MIAMNIAKSATNGGPLRNGRLELVLTQNTSGSLRYVLTCELSTPRN